MTGSRRNKSCIDAVIRQEGQSRETKFALKDRLLAGQRADHFVDEWAHAGTTPFGLKWLKPVALALEGVSGQPHLAAPSLLCKVRPVDITPAHIQFTQAGEHLQQIRLIFPQAGQHDRRLARFSGRLVMDLLHEAQKRRFGADLQEDGATLGLERLYTVGKAHGIAELTAPVGRIGQLCRNNVACHAGDNWYLWRLQRDLAYGCCKVR